MPIAGIGEDIREVIDELGMEVHILERDDSPLVERIDYDSNQQLTKPFTAEHYMSCTFTHSSAVIPGDLLYIPVAGTHYRVMNTFSEVFENMVIYKQGILYKCNTVVSVYSPVEVRDDNYHTETEWIQRDYGNVTSLITDRLYSSTLETPRSHGYAEISVKGRILYMPSKFPIEIKDRVYTEKGGPYIVSVIEPNTFPAMSMVYLDEDTRGATVNNGSYDLLGA